MTSIPKQTGAGTVDQKGHKRLAVGAVFNPYRLFTGLFIPDAVARCTDLSAGAKLAYGRLVRYAGSNGRCHPSKRVLGREIGVGERQAQKYIAELQQFGLIRRSARFQWKQQTSNNIQFLWHPVFQESNSTEPLTGGENDNSSPRENDPTGGRVNDRSPKEGHEEESHCEEKKNDIDCLLTNRKKRDSQSDRVVSLPPSKCKRYPTLKKLLGRYMAEPGGPTQEYPTDEKVLEIMDASGWESEAEVCKCIAHLYNKRGLKPGTKNGPRSWNWFPTVVQEYFTKKRERDEAAHPLGFDAWSDRNDTKDARHASGLSKEEFERRSNAF
jgi:Helix-turn-helix domain